jgi:PPE-repeat protein
MTHFSENETPVVSCDALLVQSIRIYREVGELYQSMHNQLSDTSIFQAQATVENIKTLLQDALDIDSLIAESLGPDVFFSEATEELLAKRRASLSSLQLANKNVAGRAENAKSFLRHEITGISTNRHAIKSYKPVEMESKNIVRSFF